MVVGEPVDHVLERVDAGRGDDAGLAHAAAEHLAVAPRLGDELLRAAEHGADRAAQALREAERDRVAVRREAGDRDAELHGGVEDARAVDVHGQAVLVGDVADGGEVFFVEDGAAGAVVRVLDADEAGARVVLVVRSDRAADGCRDRGGLWRRCARVQAEAADEPGAAGLVLDDVRSFADDDLFAALRAVRELRDEVALRAAGDEERGLLAEHLGGHLLQAVDRGVAGEDVVAELSVGDRLAHLRRGQRHGVAAQVDGLVRHEVDCTRGASCVRGR